MADIKQIEVQGINYNIAGAAIILEDNGTTTAGVWLAKTNQITSLVDGQMFLYKVPKYTDYSVSQTTLNITANGTSLGSKNVYLNSHGSFVCDANYHLLLIYFSNKFNIINTPYTMPESLHNYNYNYSTKTGVQFYVNGDGLYNYYGNRQVFITAFTHQPKANQNALTMFKATNNAKLMIYYSDGTPDMQFINNSAEVQMRIAGSKIYASGHLELCGGSENDRIEITDNQTKIYGDYGSHAKFNFGSGTTLTLFDDSGDETLILESNTVVGHGSMQLRTSSVNTPVLYIEPYNGTKIYMPLRDGYSARPELSFADYSHSIGTYTNRPIYLGSPNADASDASSSIAYNADEDCIEFIFN